MDINQKYLIDIKEIRNVVTKDGNRPGFEFQMKIPYYRGVALSMIDDLYVKVGEDTFPRETLVFTVDGHSYTWPQIETVTTFRWEYGQKATVFVPLEFGIFSGRPTKVEVGCTIRMSYMGRHPRPCVTQYVVNPDELEVVEYEKGVTICR
jgi:hypothetical protein